MYIEIMILSITISQNQPLPYSIHPVPITKNPKILGRFIFFT